MKILVAIKQVPVRDSHLRPDANARWIVESDLSFAILVIGIDLPAKIPRGNHHESNEGNGGYASVREDGFGAVPGWHRVTVAAVYAPTIPAVGQPFSVPLSLVPDRYRDPEFSKLVCEVKADQPNVFDFNLVD